MIQGHDAQALLEALSCFLQGKLQIISLDQSNVADFLVTTHKAWKHASIIQLRRECKLEYD